MKKLSTDKYKRAITAAVKHFWRTRSTQKNSDNKKADQGNRGAVTGGKHLDGFIDLLVKVAKDAGVPEEWVFTKGSTLPGFFRPTKNWDFVIISPESELIAVIELKSHIGSFGNNFNNRTEEALGNAVDLWTAFREKSFPQVQAPWLGYLTLVEKAEGSEKHVKTKEPHYQIRKEFIDTSYLDRYVLLCQKLMLEKHYTQAALIWSDKQSRHGSLEESISIDAFLMSFLGHLHGKSKLF
jgi:hypothetical protein